MSNDKSCTCPSGDGSLRHPCPSHPATLATVKHGGCVQLGDGLLPCPFCGESLTINGAGDGVHSRDSACILAQQVVVVDHAPQVAAWNRRARSAQPSPGGQGDALVTDEMVQAACKVWAETPGQGEDWMRTALKAALAARQPVGDVRSLMPQEVLSAISAVALIAKKESAHPVQKYIDCIDAWLFAEPTAQAVDLGPVRDVFRRWHANELNSTDAMLVLVEALALIDSQAVGK